MSPSVAVRVEGLRKRYGGNAALDGVDLAVAEGTVCGLLGPNGAGKTTTVRILSTLLRHDGGRAEVGGFDVAEQADDVRARIGLTGQYPAIDDVLTGRENLEMFGRLYHLGPTRARQRAGELLDQFALAEFADRPAGKYSGGMRRRLDVAASFIMAPPVLFLDEPTTGLDPQHRSEVWITVRELVARGATVLLTSHYLDEVDQLADRISVIDRGSVVAEGSPQQLKARIGGGRIELLLAHQADVAPAAEVLARATGGEPVSDLDARSVRVGVGDRVPALLAVTRELDIAGLTVDDIALHRPTLDDAFLLLTGQYHHVTGSEAVR